MDNFSCILRLRRYDLYKHFVIAGLKPLRESNIGDDHPIVLLSKNYVVLIDRNVLRSCIFSVVKKTKQ